MDGIRATRSSTGESVEIGLDDDGRLCARTPDDAVLQTQALAASRLKLRDDRLTWSGVEYEVDDLDEASRFVASLGSPRSRTPRIVGMVAIFLVGLVLGTLGGVFLLDRAPGVDCDEARAVVGAALEAMEEINEVEEQDRSFFAALVVEQREIAYTMDAATSCFSLTERAEAEGLLEGIRGLLGSSAG